MATVDFEQVSKTFPGGAQAVIDVSLHIDDAELVVFVGPSGCGKSTLLRLLAGLEEPTSGTIRIGGQRVNDLSPRERNVAMVFQDYALYPFMSVRRNLEFPLQMRKMGRDEIRRRVDSAAAMLEIAPLLERLPKQLSGGQRQRVAMGRALVREPSVSLLDEPLSNLDAKLRVQVRAEIADLQQRTRTTMIYVTHDQVEAMTLGHRVAVLHQGRLQQVAAPRDLYDQPANVFVAGFIGNPPMNLFPARLSRDAGGAFLSIGGVKLARRPEHAPNELSAALTAGIRPEGFALADGPGDGVIEARVEHVEYLGHETLTHTSIGAPDGAVALIARLQGMHEFPRGALIQLRVDPRHIRLFNQDGIALGDGGARGNSGAAGYEDSSGPPRGIPASR